MIQTGNFQLRKIGTVSTPNDTSRPPPNRPQQQEDSSSDLGLFTAHNTAIAEPSADNTHWEVESQSRRARPIKRTTEWRVDYEAQQDPTSMIG